MRTSMFLRGCLLLGIVVAFAISLWLLLTFPPVWPDEAIFADMAENLAGGKGLVSSVHAGLLPGIDRYVFVQPPFYFLLLSVWFKIFGFGIVAMRLFSFCVGLGCLMGVFLLARELKIGDKLISGLLVLVSWDVVFIRAAHLGRMDLLAITLAVFGVLFFLRGERYGKRGSFFLSGLFFALAILTHYVTVSVLIAVLVYWLLTKRHKILIDTNLYYFLGPLLVFSGLYLIYAAQDFSAFNAQLFLQFRRKLHVPGLMAVRSIFGAAHWGKLGAVFIWMYGFGLVYAFYQGFWEKRSPVYKLLFLIILFVFGLADLVSREIWYSIYGLPFVYLVMFMAWEDELHQRVGSRVLKLAQILLIGMLIVNLAALAIEVYAAAKRPNYFSFSETLSEGLAPGSTVLCASIPDPYFAWINSGKDYKFYEFLPSRLSTDNAYANLMPQVDTVIFVNDTASEDLREQVKVMFGRGGWQVREVVVDGNKAVFYQRVRSKWAAPEK